MAGRNASSDQSSDGGSAAPGEEHADGPKAAPDTDSPLSRIAKAVVSIGSPLALITALMFYFGWVRTHVQARELGYDVAVLQLSTTDYLLKSINVLFPILIVASLFTFLGYVGLHARHEETRRQERPRHRRGPCL